MSDGQHIYHMFRGLTFSALIALQTASLTGCSDPKQKAVDKSAEAQALFDQGRIAEARRAIDEAVAARDDILEVHLLRGRIEGAAQSPVSAFMAYNDALALDSTNGEALLGVAHYGMQSGHLEDSEDATNRILTLDPEQPDALLIKGIFNVVHNRGDDALANAQAILAKDPANENGAILKARALSILDRSDEALQLMETVGTSAGRSANIPRTLIELYRLKNDGPAMIRQFELLRRHVPQDVSVVLDEANTLYKLGDTARARDFLRRVILSPGLGNGNARLVTDLWTEYDPAPLDPASLAQVAAKASGYARKAVARFYLGRNDPTSALRAIGGGAADGDIAGLRAQAMIAQGKVADGLRAADQILDKDKTSCDALLARGQATLALRRYNDAIITSQVANANCPQSAPSYVVLARAQEGMRNDAAAEIAYRDGLTRNSQNSWLAGVYAAWLEKKGNSARAVATARRLTNAAPALLSGWKLYLDLCGRNPDAACTSEAEEGLSRAKLLFAVDRRPDDPERPGLFSRLKKTKSDDDSFDAAAAARKRAPASTDLAPFGQ